MRINGNRLDAIRAERSEVENHHIDELVAGRLDRRTFLRRGATIGMSASAMGAILAACGGANSSPSSSTASGSASGTASKSAGAPVKGGTLNLALQTPATAINPMIVDDSGGLCLLAQTGEFLTFDNNLALQLQPMLATSWSHNGDGTVWTFKLRPGVKFHNGKALTADDVVYTFKQLADPKNSSNALSTFVGVLVPSGVRKVDSLTVAFHLESANGNFPYLVSSDNYNAIIVPAGTDFSKWQSTFVGTGPFKLSSYTQNSSANFVANPDYWGKKANLDGTSFKFYESQSPQILALQGNSADVVVQFVPSGAEAILSSPQYTIIKYKSSNHRELSMRCDQAPFTDARVRQAVALCLNRPGIVNALLHGLGSVGNDNPFAPMFASTDASVPQRVQDVAKAKHLMAAAGQSKGFSVTLSADIYEEIPQLAQVVKAATAPINIDIKLNVETQSAYYGKATFGNSDWLDATMSLVNYGDRGVPNVFLDAPLSSHGSWNAAHFHNPTYDGLFKQ
ncbi:MAG: ABC transporter substrate-binding protein, partial [Gaiellaceae bacterium]